MKETNIEILLNMVTESDSLIKMFNWIISCESPFIIGRDWKDLQLPTWKVQTWESKGYCEKSIWQEMATVTL